MLEGRHKNVKKIFLVAGELSGDKLGAWYVKTLRSQEPNVQFSAVGGAFLEAAGVELCDRFEKLNVVGLVEIIKHLKFLSRFLNNLVNHIVSQNFDEVIVVDFPGFNLRLVKKLKKIKPALKITYLSPPQLWIWGAWRLKTIKRFCDDIIVLYPFEVKWYEDRGVQARWLGYPFYETFKPYFVQTRKRENIAIMPGSRLIEVKRLLPLFARVAYRFKRAHPNIKIILPLAESVDKPMVEKMLRQAGLGRWGQDIVIIQGEQEKLEALSSCCIALTKPGTVTLELALLSIPAVVAYKASWLTYVIARSLVNIECMALSNLLLGEKVYPECIQSDCTEDKIFKELEGLYQGVVSKNKKYQASIKKLGTLQKLF